MDKQIFQLDSLSKFEHRYAKYIKRVNLLLLSPLTKAMAFCRITPNEISLSQIPIAIAAIFIINDHPKLVCFLFFITVLLDGLDGVLARYTNNCSLFGKILDQSCDHFKEALMFVALILAKILNPTWGLLYVFNHGVFNLVLYACNYFKTPLPFALKPSLIVYPLILVCLWGDKAWLIKWLNYIVIASTLLMSLVIIQGFVHLQRALSGK